MSWHEKLDRLAGEFLEETDAILGAEEDKAERLRYAREIDCKVNDFYDAMADRLDALLEAGFQ
jgi:hypothetical protein